MVVIRGELRRGHAGRMGGGRASGGWMLGSARLGVRLSSARVGLEVRRARPDPASEVSVRVGLGRAGYIADCIGLRCVLFLRPLLLGVCEMF